MQELKKILNELQSTSGKLAKQDIITRNLNNERFVTVMKFLLNDFIVTGLSSKKIDKQLIGTSVTNELQTVEDMLTYLQENNTGKDSDIAVIQNFIYRHSGDEIYNLIKSIATKSIKLGVSATTWNKLVSEEDKLPVFDVMLAEKYFDNSDKVKGEFIITTKLDGNRNLGFNDLDVTMRTRQGQLYEGFVDIESEMSNLPKGYVYDGELIALDDKGLNSADLYRETTSKVRKNGIKTGVIFHVFDMLPIEDFKKGICKIPCIERKKMLKDALDKANCKWISEVPMLYVGKDKEQITYWLNKITSEGGEGVMVNIANAPYECKRTRTILKVKKMQSADLRVIGFEEGDGRLKGTLGRLNVDYKGNIVGVGSGFSDGDRTYIWNNQSEVLGKIVEIQYFEESTNNKNKDEVSLRFPVFKSIRDDKDEVSYY
jgi:DNA ligase-1